MSLPKSKLPGIACAALALACFGHPAVAAPGSPPVVSASVSPSLPMQRAQADAATAAAAAAKAYKEYRRLTCGTGTSASERSGAAQRLVAANGTLDVYIREEALLSADVREATDKSDQAAMAEMRTQSNHNASASDLAAVRKTAASALSKAQRIFQRRRDAIRERLIDSGYVFGVPRSTCG